MELTTDIGAHERVFLALEGEASRPYNRFVYGGGEAGDAVREHLFRQGASEFSPPYGRLLLHEGAPLAMLAVLPGTQLRQRRLAAAMALGRSDVARGDPDLMRRIRLAGDALLKVGADELYLARIAVAPAARGRGASDWLMERVLEEGAAGGFTRCVLEVAPENAAAVALYARHGFVEIARRDVRDELTGRTLAYAHMARPLRTERPA
ncbi:MAG TPA: GNAT family N-acetyltransferase [Gemmatimonadaceae bacterium]|nr:GNAT family N-acetyltransferase [Gemmatimonadaceae bacterium]